MVNCIGLIDRQSADFSKILHINLGYFRSRDRIRVVTSAFVLNLLDKMFRFLRESSALLPSLGRTQSADYKGELIYACCTDQS